MSPTFWLFVAVFCGLLSIALAIIAWVMGLDDKR